MLPKSPATSIIGERNVDGVVILSVQRNLKGEVETSLRERIDELMRNGERQILIDLKTLPNLDSTELGRLIRCHLAVRQAGGRVRLCNLSEKVRTLMKLTRLDTVLDLYDTEEEALVQIRRGMLSSASKIVEG
jgi:anti-sigma B factor antagonist